MAKNCPNQKQIIDWPSVHSYLPKSEARNLDPGYFWNRARHDAYPYKNVEKTN
jgi:hypothetical protein